ncbi:hypothetical protein E2C06_09720 [Dankookia rubra]|uniref:Lipoprotein n=1 Tax=Dankookia rubra TaxID=1442381 RepID=A0A4R5QJW8_9PROT|nr:hypothetical protein [Dankookia rubra]TDH62947.1 hypothetical protein E2C06_09720 [Dankookia rubra]
MKRVIPVVLLALSGCAIGPGPFETEVNAFGARCYQGDAAACERAGALFSYIARQQEYRRDVNDATTAALGGALLGAADVALTLAAPPPRPIFSSTAAARKRYR